MTIETVVILQDNRCLCEVWQTKSVNIRPIRDEILDLNISKCSCMAASYYRKSVDDFTLAICYTGNEINRTAVHQLETLIKLYTQKCTYENYGLQNELSEKIKSIIESQNSKAHSKRDVTESLRNIEASVASQVSSVIHRGQDIRHLETKSLELQKLSEKYYKDTFDLYSISSYSPREIIIGGSILLIIIYILLTL